MLVVDPQTVDTSMGSSDDGNEKGDGRWDVVSQADFGAQCRSRDEISRVKVMLGKMVQRAHSQRLFGRHLRYFVLGRCSMFL